MQTIVERLRESTSLKAAVIGFLILVLLIPVAMTIGVIEDRIAVHEAARHEMMRSWGEAQQVAGPVLVIPGTARRMTTSESHLIDTRLVVVPRELRYEATIDPEIRKRGIHEFPVYRASVRVSGVLELPTAPDAGVGMESLDLSGAYVAFAIRDPRALTTTPELNVGNTSIGFVAGGRRITALPPQLVAPVGTLLADGADTIAFTVDLEFNGTDSLAFVPLGDRTGVTVSSTWPDPSFSGTQLPRTHEISGDGFTAGWEVSEFARPAPSAWVDGTVDESLLAGSAFGVDLYMGVGLYEQSLRAARYAVLFVGLSFVAYFLFETLGQLRLHPLQYLLVGFANVLFYLLLLSLAEHSGFGIAYLFGAVASSSLIVGYSRTVLASDRRALLMAGLLFALYGYLYLVLRAETFAMLAGALGLWVILGTVMYLTRKIDWYRGGEA